MRWMGMESSATESAKVNWLLSLAVAAASAAPSAAALPATVPKLRSGTWMSPWAKKPSARSWRRAVPRVSSRPTTRSRKRSMRPSRPRSKPSARPLASSTTPASFRAPACSMAPEVWERTLKINITTPFLIARAFGQHMIARKRGVIINIASGRGIEGAANGAAYAASKAAIISLTKSLALEWAKHNIRVNTIIPGVALTAQPLENTTPEELLERGRTTIPLGRVGYPDDMAGLAAYLVSADAAYMTGQGIAMNGGRVLVPQ